MRFRTKLILLLIPALILVSEVAILLVDEEASKLIRNQTISKVLSVAATTAAVIDGQAFHDLLEEKSENSRSFHLVRNTLRLAQEANRRSDIYVRRMFAIYSDPTNKSIFRIAINLSHESMFKSHFGDEYAQRFEGDNSIDISKPFTPQQLIHDEQGNWQAAFAPIKDASGIVLGAVVVEIPAMQMRSRILVLKHYAFVALGISTFFGIILAWWISRWATRPLHVLMGAIGALGHGILSMRIAERRRDEFGEVFTSFNQMMEGLEERDAVKNAFARYVSQQVLDKVLESKQLPVLSGDKRKVTVLFSDIRQFTSLSERLSPEQVVALLNGYFERMVDIIFRHQGTLDKFMGDGLMVIFGAPIEDLLQEKHAIDAALEMQEAISELNQQWNLSGETLRVGIGINTGSAIVGNIGSNKRMEYTAIGDTVNVASRLESATKEHNVGILISDNTLSSIQHIYETRRIGEVYVKGRSEPLIAHEVLKAACE